MEQTQLVINWHITEACNYKCRYCYSKWDSQTQSKELFHNKEATENLLKNLYDFFLLNKENNYLYKQMPWSSVRLNIAGGEPTLYKNELLYILKKSTSLGFDTSIITNASQFNDCNFVKELAAQISILGISLDSAIPTNNINIGREDRNGKILSIYSLKRAISLAKQTNPNLKIKINSVINSQNYNENLNKTIELIKPDKWKVLCMLPVVNSNLSISNDDFKFFVEKHQAQNEIMIAEENKDMTESYIMIDPAGKFFQNSNFNSGNSAPYKYSHSINDIGAENAFKEIKFSLKKFSARY